MDICEICEVNPATLHISQLEDGEATTHHYCEECAEEQGLNFNIQEMHEDAPELTLEEEEILSCLKCGTSLKQFEEDRLAGCATCYTTFADAIQSFHDTYSGKSFYQGKQYRPAGSKAFRSELDYLKKELSGAVKQQKFELAAVLRDRVRELEHKADR